MGVVQHGSTRDVAGGPAGRYLAPVASAARATPRQEPCRGGCEVPEAPFSASMRPPDRRASTRMPRHHTGWSPAEPRTGERVGGKLPGWQETCHRSKRRGQWPGGTIRGLRRRPQCTRDGMYRSASLSARRSVWSHRFLPPKPGAAFPEVPRQRADDTPRFGTARAPGGWRESAFQASGVEATRIPGRLLPSAGQHDIF
jgi:hypothetical protein